MTHRTLTTSITLVWALSFAGAANAQVGLTPELSERCVRATVQVRVQTPNGTSSGSGTLIDPRGYILTNFHVVGRLFADPPHASGSLFDATNRVTILHTDSDRTEAQPQWIGQVVRGDARLDLALIRIISLTGNAPLPDGTTFPFLTPTTTSELRLGAAVYAFGFPLDARTPSVTGGHIEGFQNNADGRVSWLRTDAEFNPGNSGGLLVDEQARFIGIPTRVTRRDGAISPVEYARPAERMPISFSEAISGGATDLVIEGVVQLPASGTITVQANGDMTPSNREDFFLLNLPDQRPLTITVQSPHHLAVFIGNRLIRETVGTMIVGPFDRPGSSLVVGVILAEGDTVPQAMQITITATPALLAPVQRRSPPIAPTGPVEPSQTLAVSQ